MKVLPRIVFFHPYFSDGGVERTNIGLARELIGRGYDVAFVTINPTEHYLKEVGVLGVEWVVLSAKTTLSAQPEFVRWIRSKSSNKQGCGIPIVVISCQYYVNLACLLFKPFWGGDVRHILSERNHLDEFEMRKGIKYSVIRKMVQMLYRYADVVIANSRELAKDLERVTGCNVGVVYNPTINDRLYRMAENPITESWFKDMEIPTIVSVGRLSKQKDFETLVRAFAILREHMPSRLIILGEGPERHCLELLVEELGLSRDVLMPGFVCNPYKYIKRASMFVLSSIYEGLPNVLIEAIGLKVPVVSTRCRSGPEEILGGGLGGLLVPVGEPEKMSQAMREVLTETRAAVQRVDYAADNLDRFTPASAVSGLIAVLNDMYQGVGEV